MAPVRRRYLASCRDVHRPARPDLKTVIALALLSAVRELIAEIGRLSRALRAGASCIEPEGSPPDSTVQAPTDTASKPPGVWISADSPEWKAWENHLRAIGEKSKPRDLKNGWFFPSLTPPSSAAPGDR